MTPRSFALAAALAVGGTLVTAPAFADEQEPTHVRFETDAPASMEILRDGKWHVQCQGSCSFDVPAIYPGGLRVVTGGDHTSDDLLSDSDP